MDSFSLLDHGSSKEIFWPEFGVLIGCGHKRYIWLHKCMKSISWNSWRPINPATVEGCSPPRRLSPRKSQINFALIFWSNLPENLPECEPILNSSSKKFHPVCIRLNVSLLMHIQWKEEREKNYENDNLAMNLIQNVLEYSSRALYCDSNFSPSSFL